MKIKLPKPRFNRSTCTTTRAHTAATAVAEVICKRASISILVCAIIVVFYGTRRTCASESIMRIAIVSRMCRHTHTQRKKGARVGLARRDESSAMLCNDAHVVPTIYNAILSLSCAAGRCVSVVDVAVAAAAADALRILFDWRKITKPHERLGGREKLLRSSACLAMLVTHGVTICTPR